jgi:hypothetical protein
VIEEYLLNYDGLTKMKGAGCFLMGWEGVFGIIMCFVSIIFGHTFPSKILHSTVNEGNIIMVYKQMFES